MVSLHRWPSDSSLKETIWIPALSRLINCLFSDAASVSSLSNLGSKQTRCSVYFCQTKASNSLNFFLQRWFFFGISLCTSAFKNSFHLKARALFFYPLCFYSMQSYLIKSLVFSYQPVRAFKFELCCSNMASRLSYTDNGQNTVSWILWIIIQTSIGLLFRRCVFFRS